MTSSEDVLLQVGQVRFKKGDGTLYVMNERLAWMMDHRDTVSVSHRYADIKMQKISPEGKPKIQLQVVLHDGSASTFQFVNKAGVEVQMKERDDVKQLLQQLLVKFKVEVNKELEEKNRLLSENPAMLQLYRDLVTTQVISSEEFWVHHTSQFGKPQTEIVKQDIGVTGAFLADIKPQTDGCNGLKYNLTTDIIECIFKTYPAVRKKHLEQVPVKLTEGDFWTKFFQSHYFHRDRVHTATKDIFTECAKLDDIEIDRAITKGVNDVLVDLQLFDDKTLDEGYGTSTEKPSRLGNAVHQSMIKRFNQHSIMVMNAGKCGWDTSPPPTAGKTPNKFVIKIASLEDEERYDSEQDTLNAELRAAKKRRIQEKISLVDLEEETAGHAPVRLKLMQVDRYLQGPLLDTFESVLPAPPLEPDRSRKDQLDAWRIRHAARGQLCVSPAAAVGALGELTPGGALMKGFREDSIAHMLNKEMQTELKNLYLSTSELLRHFWACFPPALPALDEKAVTMHEALNRFHSARLKPFEDRLSREFSPLSMQLTSHLNQMLSQAYRKFVTWQQRQTITR